MGYIRLDEQPGEVYHYTHRKNLDSILRDGRIRRMGDRECWFCASLEDTLTLMRATVMMEGKPYYNGVSKRVFVVGLVAQELQSWLMEQSPDEVQDQEFGPDQDEQGFGMSMTM